MKILVINAGSSTVKFGVFDVDKNIQLYKSQLERVEDVSAAIAEIPSILKQKGFDQLDAVGHRVAHGDTMFRDAVVIDEDVIGAIETCIPLAPQHNPPALAGIKAAQKAWPDAVQVAVFDTAFHQTMPERAYTYAVPEDWRRTGLRRYGFHGTSHKYVMERTAEELKTSPDELRIISCHLGNGASVCAIERGVSVDTSMGMTPLEGLVMGSRSGDVDPGLFTHLERTLGLSAGMIEQSLYNDSGLKALSGFGNDMRDIEKRAGEGDKKAQLAINVYAYHARKYIGAYTAVMGGVDVIAFTGGIGENSAQMRKRICERFEYLDLFFNDDANQAVSLKEFEAPQIQQSHSRVKALVMQTQEKWMIARETARIVQAMKAPIVVEENFPPIPVAVSARHVHLNQSTVERLFGEGYQLHKLRNLEQPGGWAATETVDVIGPRGKLERLRVLGPCRNDNQIEITMTEAFQLGVDAPVRISGDTRDTPYVTLRGPAGSLVTNGVIVAHRHIHTNSKDAAKLGLKNGDIVEVEIEGAERSIVFRDVAVRISNDFITEMHIDTDEANAANIRYSTVGELIKASDTTAHITQKIKSQNNHHSHVVSALSK